VRQLDHLGHRDIDQGRIGQLGWSCWDEWVRWEDEHGWDSWHRSERGSRRFEKLRRNRGREHGRSRWFEECRGHEQRLPGS
jgi:hypothetical protein